MILAVCDACELHQHVLRADPAPEIDDLVDALASAGSTETATSFFVTNHVTGGMRLLLELGFRRLAGIGEQPSFVLSQAMGGGKTHMMIALGLLAQQSTLRRGVLAEAGLADELSGPARVVAITGRRNYSHYLWGEIAAQLGKPEAFRRFWAEGPRALDEADWKELLGEEPVLILMDELPAWFDYAVGLRHGGLGAVAGELARLTATASRRLQLAAEASTTIGVALRRWRRASAAATLCQPTAAATRWRVTALPPMPLPVPGGPARWFVELTRCRGGECAEFTVEACDAQGRLELAAEMTDQSAATLSG